MPNLAACRHLYGLLFNTMPTRDYSSAGRPRRNGYGWNSILYHDRPNQTNEVTLRKNPSTWPIGPGVTCPHLGSYMVEFFGTSVRTGIAHKVILTSQFVRTGIVPQLGYARVLPV